MNDTTNDSMRQNGRGWQQSVVRLPRVALALVLAGSALACSKNDGAEPGASEPDESSTSGGELPVPNSVVSKSGGKTVSALMGPPGGTLSLASGARLEVPAGALEGGVEMVLSESKMTTAFYNQESERPVGPTLDISPAIEAPEGRSIRVSIPLASYPEGWGDVAIAYEYPVGDRVGAEDSVHTRWQYEHADLSGGRAVAELPAINGYRLQFVLSNLEAQ